MLGRYISRKDANHQAAAVSIDKAEQTDGVSDLKRSPSSNSITRQVDRVVCDDGDSCLRRASVSGYAVNGKVILKQADGR